MLQVNYAVLNDGTIWEWRNASNAMVFAFVFYIGPTLGLLTGLVISVAISIVQKLRFFGAKSKE
jgi:hypothetical protein